MEKTFTQKFKRKTYYLTGLILAGILSLVNVTDSSAQYYQVSQCSGTPTGGLGSSGYGPMYSVAGANATNRTAVIYPASQLTAVVGQITNLYFHRFTTAGTMAGTPNFKIYLKEVSNSDWGSGALDWAVATTGASLVFNGDPAPIVGSAGGWKSFPLTTSFNYTGTQNLAVFFEYNNPTASTALTWTYEYTAPCISTSNSNTTKYSNNTTGTFSATLGSSDYRRPYIGFDLFLSCYPPTSITVPFASTTTSSATINWTASTSTPTGGYEYYYSPTNTPPTASTTPSGATSAGVTTATITGLGAGSVYYVWVRSVCSSTDISPWASGGLFATKPTNDDCVNAIPLTQSATCSNTPGNTAGATLSMAAAPCFGNPDDDVWFSFVATAQDAKIDLSGVTAIIGTSVDMYFQVLSGSSCGSFTSLLCSDPNSGLVGGLTIGQTYYIRVYTYPLNAGASFNICVTTLPAAPSTCGTLSAPAANALSGPTPVLSWSSVTNATQYDLYLDAANPPATVFATVTGTSYTIPAPLTPGDYYWYVVPKNGLGAPSGCSSNTRKLTVVASPPNDDCANAIQLVHNTTCTNTAGTTAGASLSMAATPCFGNPDDDVWFSFVATTYDAYVTISSVAAVIGTSTDMYFQVLAGSCGSFTSLLCSDPNTGLVGGLQIGQTYYIRVYTYGANNGASFNICLSSPPTAPTACGTISAPAANAVVNGTPALTWTAATNATAYDVYLGTANPPTTVVATVSSLTYTVLPGLAPGDYYWYVAAKNSTGGPATCSTNARKFTVLAPPANDDVVNATSLTVGTSSCDGVAFNGTSTGATIQVGEPIISGQQTAGTTYSVWYKFVAPPSGMVRVSTDHTVTGAPDSLLDSKIGVYSASDVNDFTTFQILAFDEDNGIVGAGYKNITYLTDLVPTATYYIKVDKNNNAEVDGSFCIDVMPIGPSMISPNANCAATTGYDNSDWQLGGNAWASMVDNAGLLIYNLKSNTSGTMGDIKSKFYEQTGAARQSNGEYYLNRNYEITATTQPTAPVSLQFFFTDADFNAMAAAVPALTMADLNVTRLAAGVCSSAYSATGQIASLLPQLSNGAANGVRHLTVQTPGFSSFFIHAGTSPLYIKLSEISATNVGNKNRIDWSTAAESTGDQMIFERSADGTTFTTLGSVDARGVASSYSFLDQSPLQGINFYRIRLVDGSGHSIVSKVVTATVRSNNTLVLEVYPNPASELVTVKMHGSTRSNATLTISDVTGKAIQTLPVSGSSATINLSNLAPGVYLIRYMDADQTQTVKVTRR